MLEFHEAANLFPMDDESLDALSADIKANGLEIPVELYGGKIIDGRRRYMACRMADVEPDCVEVDPADPVAYVLSLNLHRRHLTPSQKAMVAARARDMYDREAKERQKRKPADSVVENLPQQNTKARDAAGKAVGVSGKTVDFATKVLQHAEPEIIKAVDEGRMAVSTAAVHATDPPEVQRKVASEPKRNRTYKSVSKPPSDEEPAIEEGKKNGVAVIRANEAIDRLKLIPKNDALRKRGFQIVTDWIKHNK